MTDGDGPLGPGEVAVPRPRGSDGPARLVGRSDQLRVVTTSAAVRNRSTIAVLDAVAPPWLRAPSGTSEARPRAVHRPAVLRAVADDPPVPAPVPVPPVTRPPVPHHPARARPPVVPEPGILGLSRLTRGRVGSRLFTLFFVIVFLVILVQMLTAILYG